ncbi:DNA adenine methylase [Oricola indica]|uniref:DNA adenine methylase n=1 Tax=Oricola indica TaxID=2872591 RepID=UPI003CCBDE33
MSSASPLRYPGGKARLFSVVSSLISENGIENCTYSEPYAGGCGLALALLESGVVSKIKINDIDVGIYLFWDCVFHRTDEFCDLIRSTPVTVEEWHRQRDIRSSVDSASEIDYAFSVFFLNRTNRSGIIDGAGPIGGYQQAGQWLIDARYNRDRLVEVIKNLQRLAPQVEISNSDALDFIDGNIDETNSFMYLDPPYYRKAQKLYLNFYRHSDHEQIAERMKHHRLRTWIVSYDKQPEISQLYSSFRGLEYELQYSAGRKVKGTELMFFSDSLLLGELNSRAA